MRIASQGGPIGNNAYSDREVNKRMRSDNPLEIASIEGDRSLDPDHEPRKEGTIKGLKQSPSVIEIGNDGIQSEPSNAGDTGRLKGSLTRSPAGAKIMGRNHNLNSITDQSDDDIMSGQQRSLNRGDRQTRSGKKIKPMYPMQGGMMGGQMVGNNGKNILKVVQEADNSEAHESNQMQRMSSGSPNMLAIVGPNQMSLANMQAGQ